ncbi:MAG: glycine zipper 2TM domain-containing protein [Burkholderiales bacterium]
METAQVIQSKSTTHPLFIAAAGAVILFSALGSAAILGWIPKSGAEQSGSLSQAPSAGSPATVSAVAPAAPAPVTTTTTVPAINATPTAAPAQRVVRTEARPAPRHEPRPAVREATRETVQAPPAEIHAPRPVESARVETEHVVLAQAQEPPAPVRVVAPPCRECGVVESVNEIEKEGDGSGLGAVAGGVVGAIAGKQVGGGRGRDVMSVLGAIGGAFAGNAIEKNAKKTKSYDITIRFEDGSTRTLSQATPPVWRSGDKVRLINNAIQPNA